MISIIHPSRSRPQLAAATSASWIQNAGCEVEYILSLDRDDPLHHLYAPGFPFGVNSKAVTGDNKSAIGAINRAAERSTGEIIIQIADDFQCFPEWGKRIEELMESRKDWILKTQDGVQDWIITLPIMDRVYYQRFGHIYHPEYKHCWSDTELTCVAELTGCKIVSKMMFRHLNDGPTKIKDALQERNDATFEEGKKLFIERKRKNFDLVNPTGTMTPNFYTTLQ